jgi:hypothetical protein
VDLLIAYQVPFKSVVVDTKTGPNLARLSLVAIGPPAVEPLMKTIMETKSTRDGSMNLGGECTMTLVCILGVNETLELILARMDKVPEASQERANLAFAVAHLSSRDSAVWDDVRRQYVTRPMRTTDESGPVMRVEEIKPQATMPPATPDDLPQPELLPDL